MLSRRWLEVNTVELQVVDNTNDARVHQAALDLLAEVSDYLSRLPMHPMTRAVHQKVLAYLDDPSATVKRESLVALAAAENKAELVKSGQSFGGTTRFIPSGVPMMECRLLYPELRIESPAYQYELDTGGDAEAVLMHIAKDIAQGLTISMSQDVFLPRASRRLSQVDRDTAKSPEIDSKSPHKNSPSNIPK